MIPEPLGVAVMDYLFIPPTYCGSKINGLRKKERFIYNTQNQREDLTYRQHSCGWSLYWASSSPLWTSALLLSSLREQTGLRLWADIQNTRLSIVLFGFFRVLTRSGHTCLPFPQGDKVPTTAEKRKKQSRATLNGFHRLAPNDRTAENNSCCSLSLTLTPPQTHLCVWQKWGEMRHVMTEVSDRRQEPELKLRRTDGRTDPGQTWTSVLCVWEQLIKSEPRVEINIHLIRSNS